MPDWCRPTRTGSANSLVNSLTAPSAAAASTSATTHHDRDHGKSGVAVAASLLIRAGSITLNRQRRAVGICRRERPPTDQVTRIGNHQSKIGLVRATEIHIRPAEPVIGRDRLVVAGTIGIGDSG